MYFFYFFILFITSVNAEDRAINPSSPELPLGYQWLMEAIDAGTIFRKDSIEQKKQIKLIHNLAHLKTLKILEMN